MRQSKEERLTLFIAKAMELRKLAVRSEVAFFEHLAEGEKDEEMWRASGKPSFLALLKEQSICDAQRYDKFTREVAEFGIEAVRKYGVGQVAYALAVPKDEPSRKNPERSARAAIFEEFENHREERGCPPSEWQARSIAEKHYERPSAPRETPINAEIIELTEKLAKERAKVKALTERLKAQKETYEAEIKTLKAALAAAKRGSVRTTTRGNSAHQAAE